ncbi:MAG: c-type cytochrome [Planctomycetota bacterium]
MSLLRLLSGVTALLVLGLVACRTGSPTHPISSSPATAPAPATATSPAPAAAPVAAQPTATPAVQAQIDRGRMLYAQRCASCHGASGEGSARMPALIGEGSLPLDPPPGARLRTGRFETAMDLGLFIKNNMPFGGPLLPSSDVAAVLAYLLQQHGRTPTQPISPVTARAIRR